MDTSTWEQRKLGGIAPVTMGQSPNGACYTDNPNDAVLVQGNADLKDGWVFPRVWTTEITKTAKAGDLIMSVRAPVGAMGKTAYDVVLGRGVAGIAGNEFLFQALSKKEAEGYWSTVSAGSTFDSINGDELRNTPVDYPRSKPEREAVGSCLSRIDCLITLHQRTCPIFYFCAHGSRTNFASTFKDSFGYYATRAPSRRCLCRHWCPLQVSSASQRAPPFAVLLPPARQQARRVPGRTS